MNSELNAKKEELRELEEMTDLFAASIDKIERIFTTEKKIFLGFAVFQILLGLILLIANWFWYSVNFLNLTLFALLTIVALVPIYSGTKKIILMVQTWLKFKHVAKMMEKVKKKKADLEKEITEKQ